MLRCTNAIPHGRGLGSSAAAVIGGIVLARAMVVDGRDRMSDADVLQVALAFESHPDNLSAALHGGFTVAWLESDGRAEVVRLDPHADVRVMALVPPDELLTARARALLPSEVPLADAVANISRAALLVHALTTDPGRLMSATEDHLHQDRRADAFPGSLRVVGELRERGIPAVISGAGPTVLAFPPRGSEGVISGVVDPAWSVLSLPIAQHGAREVPLPPLA
jgi:homoserine kinase